MLDRRQSYLQIAFNRSLGEVLQMVSMLPKSNRIIVEAGTPFIKEYGEMGIRALKEAWGGYLVADLKCMDRGSTEVVMAKRAGANAVTCLAWAPIPTIDAFIEECAKNNLDAMVDMMNVEFPFEILTKLKTPPPVVVLHRGVDELEGSDKELPLYDIHKIKGLYGNVLISVAGGESPRAVRRTIFNDADIAVVWRSFYDNPQKTADLANEFLSELR